MQTERYELAREAGLAKARAMVGGYARARSLRRVQCVQDAAK